MYPPLIQHIKKNFKNSAFMPNILVFMPSVKHIKDIIAHITEDSQDHFKKIQDEIHFVMQELHGAMKPREKQKVITPDKSLKKCVIIIFASKIAETAITLEDIYYVLDSGLEREYFYDETTKMSFIREEKISKSSADQRKGRAGRVGNGYCFKMYKQEEELKFRTNKIPEIQRMDISDIILAQIKLQHLFNLNDVMFYNHPGFDLKKIQQIVAELVRIEAITITPSNAVLSKKGEFILGMSCSTHVGAFLYECYKLNVLDLGIITAGSLENIKGFFKENVKLQMILGGFKELF
jgi:HrpA-like RNA helicase